MPEQQIVMLKEHASAFFMASKGLFWPDGIAGITRKAWLKGFDFHHRQALPLLTGI